MTNLTSRKKRPLDRSRVEFKDSLIFIIATEGKITEPQYFNFLKSNRVQVEVLPTINGESSPQAVLERLNQYAKDYQLGEGDQLFLVIDKDRWPEKNLSDVAKACNDQKYTLALSNPCFELWLHLHHGEIDLELKNCEAICLNIKKINGAYAKNALNPDDYSLDKIKNAIELAKKLENGRTDRWPQELGTHVYKILEEILPHLV